MRIRKRNLRLTEAEAVALLGRLVPIRPIEYDLATFAILRDLTGRLERIIQTLQLHQPLKETDHENQAS